MKVIARGQRKILLNRKPCYNGDKPDGRHSAQPAQ